MATFHVHSDYSVRDGISKVPQIADYNKSIGNDYFVITDHGNFNCYSEAFEYANKVGMKFVPGIEFYVKPAECFDADITLAKIADLNKKIAKIKSKAKKDITEADEIEVKNLRDQIEIIAVPGHNERYYHITAIAYNKTGMLNLFKIFREGDFYYKTRVTMDSIKAHKEGIILLTGCPQGELFSMIKYGYLDEAKEFLIDLKNEFGDNLYYELMYHDGIDFGDYRTYNEKKMSEFEICQYGINLAHELGIKIVCTNDSHYISNKDRRYWEITRKANLGNDFDTGNGNYSMNGCSDDYLAQDPTLDNERRLSKIFDLSYDELKANEKEVSDKFEKIESLPRSNYTSTRQDQEKLERLVWTGFKEKRIKPLEEARRNGTPEEIKEKEEFYRRDLLQIPYELAVIQTKGFDNYFLKTLNVVDIAKRIGILVGPGRGSGSGSSCVYLIGITEVDPIKFELMFERFLNPGRNAMPDIDIDLAPNACQNFNPDSDYIEWVEKKSNLVSDDEIRQYWESYKVEKANSNDNRRNDIFNKSENWKEYFECPIFDAPESAIEIKAR